MKILLISDTHGAAEETADIMKQHPFMDRYIHLGDVGFPLQNLSHFTIIKGNHDKTSSLPHEKIFTFEKRHILCMHGNIFDEETIQEVLSMHSIDEKNLLDICMQTLYSKLAAYARKKECDTVFFGHTHHQCDVEMNGVRIINPGSVCLGTPHSGYAVINIDNDTIKSTFYETRGMYEIDE